MPSSAADWSAAKPASPVTYARRPSPSGSGTIARIAATSLTTVSVASSLVQTVTSCVVWSSDVALIGLDCGGVSGGSSPHASWTGVITRTMSGICRGSQSVWTSDAIRSRSGGVSGSSRV